MKKIILMFTAILLIAVMISPAAYAAGDRGKALIVYGYVEDAIGDGDKAVAARLESLGYATDFIAAPDSNENSWKGYDIVFIGESVTSADVDTKFTLADTLVIVGEPGLWDEMLMGNYDSTYDSEAYTGSYTVINDIIGCGLKTFKGFKTDDVIPGFFLDYADGVQIIAENEKGSPAVTMVAPGGKLTDGSSAVNYRFSLFCRRQDAADFSDDSWKIFDTIVEYVYPSPVIEEVAAEAATEPVQESATEVISPQTSDMTIIISMTALISAAGIITYKKRK